MRIARLYIKNFRGIENFPLECGPSLNVLVGVNGAGKSTLLHAIDILFSWFIARLRNVNGKGTAITDEDIMSGKVYCSLEVELDNGVRWGLYKQKSSHRQKPQGKTYLEQMTEYINRLLESNEQSPNTASLPLVASYGVTRVVDSTPARVRKNHAMGMMDVYNREMENRMNFQTFFTWFREREDIENERLRETGVLAEDPQLNAVRFAISETLPGYRNLRVQRSPKSFVIDKEGRRLKFDQLSDGEKSYIVLVADIARKLSMTHPYLNNPIQGAGIVLVDEIDLHLHPRWQRDVIPMICRVFPNCQFILSTHSPLALAGVSAVSGKNVVLLSEGRIKQSLSDDFMAKNLDRTLLEDFEMPSLWTTEVQTHLDKVWDCLRADDCQSEKYMENMAWLRKNMDPSDSELIRIAVQERIIKGGKNP